MAIQAPNSETDVCDLALARISISPLGSIENGTRKAGECKRYFAQVRNACLRMEHWNFAEAKASLPALSAAPAWGFTKAYQLPNNCVDVRHVEGATRNDWKVVGTTIETDLSAPLKISYTRDDAPVGDWDPLFVDAVALQLAAKVAPQLLGRGQALRIIQAEAEMAMEKAEKADAQEHAPETVPDSDITLVRGGEPWADDPTKWSWR